ncbi:MAG TPA: hypothetical protein PKE66_08540, partial [Pyrinomonadaceae bacterium]|nr:hypothetical protein [Pyrinomonadaceae bacterium]
LRRHEPDASWNLMVALLPEMHGIGHPSAKPRWREWNITSEPSVTCADIWKLTESIVDRMLEDVGVSAEKWSSLLYALGRVPKPQHESIVANPDKLDVETFTTDDRTKIWETLRKIISRHREFADAEWALPADVVDELEKVYEKFRPTDEIVLYSWLFRYGVELLHPPADRENWQYREEIVNGIRKDALVKLYRAGGVDTLLRFAESVDEPPHAGFLVGQLDILSAEDIDRIFDDYLDSENAKHNQFAMGVVTGFFRAQGWDWAEKKFNDRWPDWSARRRLNFLASLSFEAQVWDLLESINDAETESDYLKRVIPGYNKTNVYERPIRKLIEYKRPQFAVDFLAHRTYDKEAVIAPEFALEVLEGLISVTNDSETQIAWGDIGHYLTRLMSVVRNSSDLDESRIAKIEFLIFPLLENYGDGPMILHRQLARDPAFFADLIKVIFRSDDENVEKPKVSESYITAAFKLLNSWRICPGAKEEGKVDRDALRNWVEQARMLVHESGRGVIGDQQIGQAFAESPFGSDNLRPHEHVRELIEELANSEIERGFEIRVFNNRGVTVRGPTSGGELERALVERYRSDADKISDDSPRTAAMLRRLAENYDRHARREDERAELTEDFWRY